MWFGFTDKVGIGRNGEKNPLFKRGKEEDNDLNHEHFFLGIEDIPIVRIENDIGLEYDHNIKTDPKNMKK